MHQAICAQCGKPCEVPFKPTSGRPVYCNDCFGSKKETGGNRDRGGFGGNASKGNDHDLKRQLEMLNSKMDRLINVAEIMANIKPLVVKEKAKEAVKAIPVVKAKKSAKKTSKK
jgi:CxxC-x17-CxxC domain-containing protein